MERRWIRLASVCGCLVGLALTGCGALGSRWARRGAADDVVERTTAYDAYLEDAASDDPAAADPKRIFKPTRRPGGLSREAREIERDTFNIE